MVVTERVIRLIQPIAPGILEIDAAAIARVKSHRSDFAGYDRQPGEAALAMERRAYVVTEARKLIAAEVGWPLNEKKLPCGGYEWLPDGISVRLAKTTPESRREAAKALLGIQGEFDLGMPAPRAEDPREVILIRLMGNLDQPKIDVLSLADDGLHGTAIPLRAIASANTEQLPSSGTPSKPGITLPGERRISESG
jgi:hypothetical protein